MIVPLYEKALEACLQKGQQLQRFVDSKECELLLSKVVTGLAVGIIGACFASCFTSSLTVVVTTGFVVGGGYTFIIEVVLSVMRVCREGRWALPSEKRILQGR